jgi:hypothetical protein
MKAYKLRGGKAPPIYISAVDGIERSASNSGNFASGKRAPDTHVIEGWVAPD